MHGTEPLALQQYSTQREQVARGFSRRVGQWRASTRKIRAQPCDRRARRMGLGRKVLRPGDRPRVETGLDLSGTSPATPRPFSGPRSQMGGGHVAQLQTDLRGRPSPSKVRPGAGGPLGACSNIPGNEQSRSSRRGIIPRTTYSVNTLPTRRVVILTGESDLAPLNPR